MLSRCCRYVVVFLSLCCRFLIVILSLSCQDVIKILSECCHCQKLFSNETEISFAYYVEGNWLMTACWMGDSPLHSWGYLDFRAQLYLVIKGQLLFKIELNLAVWVPSWVQGKQVLLVKQAIISQFPSTCWSCILFPSTFPQPCGSLPL